MSFSEVPFSEHCIELSAQLKEKLNKLKQNRKKKIYFSQNETLK